MAWKKRGIRIMVRLLAAVAAAAALILIFWRAGAIPGARELVAQGGVVQTAERTGRQKAESAGPGGGNAASGAKSADEATLLADRGSGGQSDGSVHLSKASVNNQKAFGTDPGAAQTAGKTASPAVKVKAEPAGKIVYLTFDDGPSRVTPQVLEILQRENVKATFFVLGDGAQSHPDLIREIRAQGHVIGNHSYDHNYKDLYSGFTHFWNQIKKTEEILNQITGERPRLVRAPGGTAGHFDDTYFKLLKQAGYTVTDWTVDSGDSARRGVPAADIASASVANLKSSRVVLLLHDGSGHEESAKALPRIIEAYKAAGYSFRTLDPEEEPVQFKVHGNKSMATRPQPQMSWVAAHIGPNAALLEGDRPLIVEAAGSSFTLKPGEYSLENGRYYVPLRAVVERLGGRVTWDSQARCGRVLLNGRAIAADAVGGGLTVTDGGAERTVASAVALRADALWLPLRDLLGTAGYTSVFATSTPEERRVRAS
ncbi:polysaccharide deacetylase family protein [Paenibacillus sp. HN-1]|uniref:polysaccharide deacetylase n=1 Tax=Paenibacillus TaxID=44249 RepID=UPI001CA7FAE5|nr:MULTISPECIES: polysaccharide deacetylase [Paenibacillus]MBY9079824.1 polysaccharide deacetylase family protein [Paenibacillus sp. CGMCC 1.18879]MBY9084465.1 polysaccharide deacetylase family protein [Paenibacillus sinensis]